MLRFPVVNSMGGRIRPRWGLAAWVALAGLAGGNGVQACKRSLALQIRFERGEPPRGIVELEDMIPQLLRSTRLLILQRDSESLGHRLLST